MKAKSIQRGKEPHGKDGEGPLRRGRRDGGWEKQ